MEVFRYRELHQNLRTQIVGGVYRDGDLLPSENELSALHKLNRATVRQALNELEKEGYITKKKGKGSIVTLQRKRLGLLSFKGFSEVVGPTEHTIANQILTGPELQPWPENFFYPLTDLELAAGCIYLNRLRYVNGAPVMLEFTYIPNLNLPRFTRRTLERDSLFATLQTHYQIGVNSVDQDVRALKAEGEIAALLKIPPGDPVLHLYRKYGTTRDNLFIYSSFYFNTVDYAIGSFFK
jgi:DNA-binding GntR family transcriptional regulator